jgi:hypothetical protein
VKSNKKKRGTKNQISEDDEIAEGNNYNPSEIYSTWHINDNVASSEEDEEIINTSKPLNLIGIQMNVFYYIIALLLFLL